MSFLDDDAAASGLTAEQILEAMRGPAANGTATLDAASRAHGEVQAGHVELESMTKKLIGTMAEAWRGDAAELAHSRLNPMVSTLQLSQDDLARAKDLTSRQSDSFHDAANALVPVPPKPNNNLLNVMTPWHTDLDDEINRWNAAQSRNIQVYASYTSASTYNHDGMPTSYGDVSSTDQPVNVRLSDPGHGAGEPIGNGSSGGVDGTGELGVRPTNEAGIPAGPGGPTATQGYSGIPTQPTGAQLGYASSAGGITSTGVASSGLTGSGGIGGGGFGGTGGEVGGGSFGSGGFAGATGASPGGWSESEVAAAGGRGPNGRPSGERPTAADDGRSTARRAGEANGRPAGIALRGNGRPADNALRVNGRAADGSTANGGSAGRGQVPRGQFGTATRPTVIERPGADGMPPVGNGRKEEDREHKPAAYLEDDYSGDIVGELPPTTPPVIGLE
jgi:hypothetical protein